jgi:hypothetical protein
VRAELVRIGLLAVFATIALAILLALFPGISWWATRAWLLLLGLIALAGLVPLILGREVEDDGPTWRPSLPRRPPRRSVRQLEELERLTEFATATAFDFHHRLRPHLVRVAEHRLAARGIRLAGQPERARTLLGDDAWDLVRPDREPPDQRHAPGVSASRIGDLVERLRAL